jgi:diacylglycerol O-acyltransferase
VARKFYERLSSQDSSFIFFEGSSTHVHVTAIAVFEGEELLREGGGLARERIRAHVASRLHLLPHYRQRLAFTPVQRHPVWIDDAHFDLDYHLRHTALPQPGDDAQLHELAGRVSSHPLDHDRPLWELWFVEGLSERRFAVVAKVHHCMVDGVSGVGVLTTLLSASPEVESERELPWKPRAAPGVLDFLADGAGEMARLPLSGLSRLADALRDPRLTATTLTESVGSAWQTLVAGITPPAATPLNRPTGLQRRIAGRTLDLVELRDLRKRLDGSLNDVVLAIVAGALRRLLKRRRTKLKGLELRVIVPVDSRRGAADMHAANRVSAWFLSLPVGEPSPLRRFQKIQAQTRRLKRTNAAKGIDQFHRLADWAGSSRLIFWFVSLISTLRPYNLVVTNIHGPDFPLYLLGARLLAFYPFLPLFEHQGLAVAAMSYLEKVYFGLIGDRDLVPDLDPFADALAESLSELTIAAEKR